MDTVAVETEDPETHTDKHIHLIKLATGFTEKLQLFVNKWTLLWQLYQRLAVAFLSVQQPYKMRRNQIKPPML